MKHSQEEIGRLVVLEGPDGVGKSTLAGCLTEELQASGVSVLSLSFPGRRSGTLGELVYRVHHHPSHLGVVEPVSAAALQLLHIAAHIDVIESTIKPALDDGQWVVLDRYWWSTWVYGRASGVSSAVLDQMIEVEIAHWADRKPDPVFLVSRSEVEADDTLTHLYGQVADRQMKEVRVVRLANDRTLSEAAAEMVADLNQELA